MRHNHRRSEVPVVMQTTAADAATPQQSAPVVGAASQQRPKRGQSACSSSEVKPMATAAHPSSTTGGRRRRQQHRATAASHQAHGPQPEKTEGAGDVVAAAAPAPTNAPQKKQRRRRVKPRAQELLRTQSTGPSPHEGPVQMEGEAHFTTCRSAALEDNARPSSSFRSAFPSHPDFPDGNADVALPSVLSPPNKRRASRLSPSLDGSMASTPNHLHSFSVGGTRPSMAQPQREAATAHASPASFVLAAFGPSHGLNATNTQENLGRSSDESRRGLRVEAAEFCPKIYLAAAQNALTQRSMMKAPPPLSFSPGSTTSTAGHTHGRMAKTPTSPSRRHSIATCHDTRPSSSPMVKATSDGLHSFSPDLAAAEHPDLCAERCSSGKNTPGSVHVYSHSGFVMRSPSSNRAPHLHHRTISGTLLLDEGDKDHVRHNRVAVSDWVAKNEDEMIDLLMAAADEAEVEEAPAERFCSGDVFPSGGDLPSLPHAGYRGAFAPSEQSARRRDSESSLSVCGVATPAALHLHVSGRGSMADFPSSDMMFGGSSPDASPVAPMDIAFDHLVDVWEYNSSAYEDSLDDAEMEWIEEQLRANENPEGFFV